jgi:hypothetical protein
MILTPIKSSDFEIYNCNDEVTKFYFKDDEYELILSDLQEVRMSVYIYFNVRLFKRNKLILSGEMLEPSQYYEPYSPNRKFVYIPLNGGGELINLETNEKIICSVNWINGNTFNQNSSKMILNGTDSFKIIDLDKMKVTHKVSKKENSLCSTFFKTNDVVWSLRENGKVDEFYLTTKKKNKNIPIISPFEKFSIDKSKYQSLINLKTHCLKIPEGGMAFSGRLNLWTYINTNEKLVLETLIPTSEIKFSEGYRTDYCDVERKFVEVK